jgi:uncharacterized protein (UPF0335 family)
MSESTETHNTSAGTKKKATGGGVLAREQLRDVVARIERLEEQKKEVTEDIKEVYKTAKSTGLNVDVIKALIAERRKDPVEVEEKHSLLDTYRRALEIDD